MVSNISDLSKKVSRYALRAQGLDFEKKDLESEIRDYLSSFSILNDLAKDLPQGYAFDPKGVLVYSVLSNIPAHGYSDPLKAMNDIRSSDCDITQGFAAELKLILVDKDKNLALKVDVNQIHQKLMPKLVALTEQLGISYIRPFYDEFIVA